MKRRKTAKGDSGKAVLFVRVSTDEQSLGPDAQRAAAERWAASRGVSIVATFEDIGVSGAAPLDACPGLLGALAALETHGAGVLLVAKRDRLARDVMRAGMVEALATSHGAVVVSCAGEGEGDDPAAALLRRMIDAFSEFERACIASRTKAALGVKARRGERVGAVPFGKRLAEDGVRLEDDPDEQAIVRTARELRGAGATLATIGAELDRRGLRTRSGKPWHPEQVKRLCVA